MKKVSEGAGHEANAAQVSDGTQENKKIPVSKENHPCFGQFEDENEVCERCPVSDSCWVVT